MTFEFTILKHVATLSNSAKGWTMELNLVSWGGRPAKYEIRDWNPDHDQCGKGSTFTAEELTALREVLNKMDL